MLRDFEDEAVAAIRRLEGVENLRQMLVELHVDDGADDLGDPPRGPVARIRWAAGRMGHSQFSHSYLELPV